MITGGCVSTTVTLKLHVAVLPDPSVAVAITVVVPFGNGVPDAGLETTVTPGQLSIAVTVKFTTAEHCPVVAGTVILVGHITVGFCVSLTVTVNEQLAGLPAASATVQLTVVVPFEKNEPEGGLHDGVPAAEQLSLTVGAG